MAAKKKVKAKVKFNRGNKSLAPKAVHDIPDGFIMPATAQVPNWNFEKQSELTGQIVSVKIIKTPKNKNKKQTRLMIIRETDTGKLLQLWESAALVGLFDEAKVGYLVYLRYDGLAAKQKGKNPMKLFTVGYQKSR